MKRAQKLSLRVSPKSKASKPITQWAAGGQSGGKITKKDQKLLGEYLRYLEANRKP